MKTSRLRAATVVAATVVYLLVLVAFASSNNPAVVLLSAVPVVIGGAYLGLRFVVLLMVGLAAATILVIEGLGPGFGELFRIYRGIPVLILVMVGLVVGRLRDVTDAMKRELEHSQAVELELRAAQRQLEESLAAKDELIASVGHELRTPLTAVLGFAELLRIGIDSEMPASERHEMVSLIAREAFGLSSTIDDLLVAARIEIGMLEVTRVPTSLRAQVAQVVESWDQTQVTNVEISGEDVRAIGDPARVRQILRNLIANGLTHGGTNVRVQIAANGSNATVTVSDDGPGLPPGEWESIFEPYYRYASEASQPGSLGLGLSVSRGLAQLMDGALHYENGSGESLFVLSLPLATS